MKGDFKYQTATTFWARLKGLMGQTEFVPMLIPNCRAVHTFGMKVPLDLVWLDADYNVLRVEAAVPSKTWRYCRAAAAVLECPTGTGAQWRDDDFMKPTSKTVSFYKDESGQALVETAFVLPILILLVFGFIQLGVAMSQQQKLIYTANYATQVGSITNDDLRVIGAVEEFFALDEITIAIENFDGATGNALSATDRFYQDVIRVQLTHPFELQIPFVSVTVLNLQVEASARILCNATALNPICT